MTTTTRASGEAGTSSTDATPTSFSLEARTHHTHKPPYKYQAAVLQLLRPVLSSMSVAQTFFTLTHNETIKKCAACSFCRYHGSSSLHTLFAGVADWSLGSAVVSLKSVVVGVGVGEMERPAALLPALPLSVAVATCLLVRSEKN
jgi:hypothetical protein